MAFETSPTILAWLAAVFLVSSVVTFVLSALLERSGPIRLRQFAEEAGGVIRAAYEKPRRFDAFRFLFSSSARIELVGFCLAGGLWLERLGYRPIRAALAALTAGAATVLLIELSNRKLIGSDKEGALRKATGLYRVTFSLLTPLVTLLVPLVPSRTDDREELEDEATDEEIEAFIAVGTEEGILEPEESEYVRGIVDFVDSQVRSVMTPRTDVVCAPVESSLDELAQRFLESLHSRLPLYKDSIDHVVGILHIRDLLRGLYADERPPVVELARPAFFVPVTKRLGELLRELQANQQQLAIVVDEYGGTAGLVTMEDLVEEIVGDIADEHELVDDAVQRLPDGSWRLDGRTHLEDVADICGVEIDDGPYETIAGLVLGELGAVPEYGTVVERDGLLVTVEQVDDRRIQTVRVSKSGDGEDDLAG